MSAELETVMAPGEDSLESRYLSIRSRVPAGVCLIAVSKTKPYEAIAELYRLGHRDFGENYAQELVEKAERAAREGLTEIRWHFIGHLQTNKAKLLAPHAHAIHAVDSEKLAREISKRAESVGRSIAVFIEVNWDGETSKAGATPEETPALAERVRALPSLRLEGLMMIPDPTRPGGARAAFEGLRELEKRCQPATRGFLSMGMTSDFEEAIRSGSTHVRVGTAIFGERNVRG